jgi:rare lipoprotein A
MDGRPVSLKGEKYDKNGLTAATHSSFPLGCKVRVTNLRNRKSVVLRVTDRMNPRSKAIIDVSHRAADQLGMIHSGHAQVRVEFVSRS